MAYSPYYGYQNGYYQPLMADQQRLNSFNTVPQQTQPPQQNPINWVQGEEAAKAYLVAPGNTVVLMDSERNRFYIKSTDAQGMPTPLRVFEYTELEAPSQELRRANSADYVTRAEFDALAARIDKLATPAKEEVQNEQLSV